jgi:hypothetical protein
VDLSWPARHGDACNHAKSIWFPCCACKIQEKIQTKMQTTRGSRNDRGTASLNAYQSRGGEHMRKIAISIAAGALLATAANAAPLSSGITSLPDSNIEKVRLVCNEDGRCWRERGERRVIIRDSYDYAPRERYIERRDYYDEPRPGIGFRAPGVSIGVGGDRW